MVRKIQLQMVITSDDGETKRIENIAQLERNWLNLNTLGLSLAESKDVLEKFQKIIVTEQVETQLRRERLCAFCSEVRSIKGCNNLVIRSLFGKLTIKSPRWYGCSCKTDPKFNYSPLVDYLPERTTPELLYLETKYASLMSYGLSVNILSELLPIGTAFNQTTVRNHQQQVAERLEKELGDEQTSFIDGCPGEWGALPRPETSLIVGIDGGYVHAREGDNRKAGWFEVIVGKSGSDNQKFKSFGFVNNYDKKPRRRVFEALRSQGMQNNQQVTFFSDGGDTVRNVQFYLNPSSEHIIDWFHITMRLTVMKQMLKGLPKNELASVSSDLERVKWFLWHGNTTRASEILEEIDDFTLEDLVERLPAVKALHKALREFRGYIQNNVGFIPNYGDRYRHGEIISTSFVESTVNQVISKRFVKKQQMRWTQRGVHLLIQTRTKVLNNELQSKFQKWYPAQNEKIPA